MRRDPLEAHATARMFPTERDPKQAGLLRPLPFRFHNPADFRWPVEADYADSAAAHFVGCQEWQHFMGDILIAVIGAALVIEWLHEFPYRAWPVIAGCEIVERLSRCHPCYGLPALRPQVPLRKPRPAP